MRSMPLSAKAEEVQRDKGSTGRQRVSDAVDVSFFMPAVEAFPQHLPGVLKENVIGL